MQWQAIAVGLIPSIGVALVFWLGMRAVIRADRNERAALARIEQEDAQAAAQAPGAAPAPSSPAQSSAEQPSAEQPSSAPPRDETASPS